MKNTSKFLRIGALKWFLPLIVFVVVAVVVKGRNNPAPEIEKKLKTRVSQTQKPEPVRSPAIPTYPLAEASRQKLISWKAGGAGLTTVELQISSRAKEKIRIEIPEGVIFVSANGSVQNMVVRTAGSANLYPGRTESLRISAACINMHRQTPRANHGFQSGLKMADGDLETLLKSPDFAGTGFRIQQYAIWTITDNPGRGEYPGISSSGSGGGPSKEELMQVRRLLESAGVRVERYRAFQDGKTSSSSNRPRTGRPDPAPVEERKQLYTWIDEKGVRHFSDQPPK